MIEEPKKALIPLEVFLVYNCVWKAVTSILIHLQCYHSVMRIKYRLAPVGTRLVAEGPLEHPTDYGLPFSQLGNASLSHSSARSATEQMQASNTQDILPVSSVHTGVSGKAGHVHWLFL